MTKKIIFVLILLFTNTNFLHAEEYFLTLRNDITNLRKGPSFDYPIKIFTKKNTFQL